MMLFNFRISLFSFPPRLPVCLWNRGIRITHCHVLDQSVILLGTTYSRIGISISSVCLVFGGWSFCPCVLFICCSLLSSAVWSKSLEQVSSASVIIAWLSHLGRTNGDSSQAAGRTVGFWVTGDDWRVPDGNIAGVWWGWGTGWGKNAIPGKQPWD